MGAKKIGFVGEDLAAQYLKSKGYRILKNNFTIKGGEIDLIAQRGETLIFVEVKTRRGNLFGSGGESFNRIKKRHIHQAINRYLSTDNNEDADFRVDLVEIELDPKTNRLKNIYHFEDIEL